ncbi:hypothetical protein DFJ43DRAFT_704925 [Lentinula guzmanii]|uniref:Mid2 domain-containing protein n=1 Tax=Lentinula guzmanii TaxID=2804957 RepID=A0AA38JFM8_9AGAR|nr:hypothetical protein DFJ43DRAFT_704925 [Lentinula guzmanii]
MDATNAVRWLAIGIVLMTFQLEFHVTAQETDATCVLASLQWSLNSQKQSPCAVASSLIGVCTGGDYNVVALPNTDSDYLGPSIDAANPCQCNTVVYSLMSACSLCQNGTIITWSEWTTNCATIYDDFPKPIPDGLRVPAYAYLDVEAQDTFDANAAMQDANATESTALPSSTSKISSTQSSITVSQTSSARASANTTSSASESLTAPSDPRSNSIGGGVVGGILGLALLLLFLGFFITLRRRRRSRTLLRVNSDSEQGAPGSPAFQGTLDISSNNAGSASSVSMSEVRTGVTQQTNSETPNGVLRNVPSISVVSSSSGN